MSQCRATVTVQKPDDEIQIVATCSLDPDQHEIVDLRPDGRVFMRHRDTRAKIQWSESMIVPPRFPDSRDAPLRDAFTDLAIWLHVERRHPPGIDRCPDPGCRDRIALINESRKW